MYTINESIFIHHQGVGWWTLQPKSPWYVDLCHGPCFTLVIFLMRPFDVSPTAHAHARTIAHALAHLVTRTTVSSLCHTLGLWLTRSRTYSPPPHLRTLTISHLLLTRVHACARTYTHTSPPTQWYNSQTQITPWIRLAVFHKPLQLHSSSW